MAVLVVGTTYSITGTPSSATTYQTAGIDYMVVSQDTANNTSLIRIRPWIRKSGGTGAYSYTDRTMTIYAVNSAIQKQTVHDYDQQDTTNNVKYYLTSNIPFRRISGEYEPFEFTVAHSADGTYAALPLYAYIDLQNSGTGRIWTVDTTVELPTINRQSTLSEIADFGIDDTITLDIEKYVVGYTDKLKIEIGATQIRAEATVVDTDEITFTAGEKTDIEAEMTGPEIEMTFTLTSYNGATPIGTSVVTATCSSLNQSILRSWVKTATGYQMAINGLVDGSLDDGLQVNGKLYQIEEDVNYVASGYVTGSDTYYNYEKYSDGKLIIYGVYPKTVAITTAWGNIYIGPLIALPDFPTSFYAAPTVWFTAMGDGIIANIGSSTLSTTSNPGSVYMNRGASGTDDFKISIYAIGRWKE